MAQRKARKFVAWLAVLALATAVIPATVFAVNTVAITATVDGTDDPTINVTGTISGDGEVTLLALKSASSLEGTIPASVDQSAIMYIDQKTAENGTVNIAFKLRDTEVEGDYLTLFMGGTDVAQYASFEIELASNDEPAIAAEDVTVATRANVYGMTGGKLIKVVADIDPATKSIAVGGQTLYYSVDKGAYYGVVTAANLEADAVTGEAVAGAAVISDVASASFYFGKVSNPANPRSSAGKVTALDVANGKKIVLGTSTPAVNAYLAADVNSTEPDGNITALDIAALKKNVLSATPFKVLGE